MMSDLNAKICPGNTLLGHDFRDRNDNDEGLMTFCSPRSSAECTIRSVELDLTSRSAIDLGVNFLQDKRDANVHQ